MDKQKIVFEIANNHQGSIEHFQDILHSIHAKIDSFKDIYQFVFKFQFRDLDSFINPNIKPESNKHISRFRGTRLSKDQFEKCFKLIRNTDSAYKIMVTPFDEISIASAKELGVDYLKIASCSSNEWSLLEESVKYFDNVTVSTGGKNINEVDSIYSFMINRGLTPNILHCCAIYPAPEADINLSTISKFKKRYPKATIGYSGHESPSDHTISCYAQLLGARIFERHVGLPNSSKDIKLNDYSLNPQQVEDWLTALSRSKNILGAPKNSTYNNEVEINSMNSLQRGVLLKHKVDKGKTLSSEDCKFAFPLLEGQVSVSEFTSINNTFTAHKNLEAGSELMRGDIQKNISVHSILEDYVHTIRGILNEGGTNLSEKYALEISHHYGLENIKQTGCCIVNIVNRSYCKKFIVMSAGQNHPAQYHEIKEETFRIVYGELELTINDKSTRLYEGDECLVRSRDIHSFRAITDCIIEELSTISIPADSYYLDPKINELSRDQRKTFRTSY